MGILIAGVSGIVIGYFCYPFIHALIVAGEKIWDKAYAIAGKHLGHED